MKKGEKEGKEGKRSGCLSKVLIVFVVLLVIGILGSALGGNSDNDAEDESTVSESQESSVSEDATIAEEDDATNESEAIEATEEVSELTAETSEEPAKELVVTDESEITTVDYAYLLNNPDGYVDSWVRISAPIGNSAADSFTVSGSTSDANGLITCNAQIEFETYPDDTYVTVVGYVESGSSLLGFTSVSLVDCYIEDTGDSAKELSETLYASYAAMAEELAAQSVADYKASCVTVDYNDVERNPSNYDGTLIKVSGTVIQESETTLFGITSVTLRVDSGGNTWYVTYTLGDGESRILEDDYVTIYGECGGVETYTTILGSSVTIPCVDAEYIEIS